MTRQTAPISRIIFKTFFFSVHLRLQEKLSVRLGRDGGVQQFELHGLITLHIRDEKWAKIRVQLDNQNNLGVQLQTHPNVDKELFKMRSQVNKPTFY